MLHLAFPGLVHPDKWHQVPISNQQLQKKTKQSIVLQVEEAQANFVYTPIHRERVHSYSKLFLLSLSDSDNSYVQ